MRCFLSTENALPENSLVVAEAFPRCKHRYLNRHLHRQGSVHPTHPHLPGR